MVGSDYPFDMGDSEPVETLNAIESITLDEKGKILGENAMKVLGWYGGVHFQIRFLLTRK